MFDIGFWELMIIGLVALVVVGPERLPKLAYTAGKWLGKGRKMISAVKDEIDKEMKAEELKEILEKQKKEVAPLEEVVEETSATLHNFAADTQQAIGEAEKSSQESNKKKPEKAVASQSNDNK